MNMYSHRLKCSREKGADGIEGKGKGALNRERGYSSKNSTGLNGRKFWSE